PPLLRHGTASLPYACSRLPLQMGQDAPGRPVPAVLGEVPQHGGGGRGHAYDTHAAVHPSDTSSVRPPGHRVGAAHVRETMSPRQLTRFDKKDEVMILSTEQQLARLHAREAVVF